MNQNELMEEALRTQVPHLKTQAQMNAFMVTLNAFRVMVDSIFARDKDSEAKSREILEKGFEACRIATDISEKLNQVPEAASAKVAQPFVQPPVEFTEENTQKRLLEELAGIPDLASLETWYSESAADRNSITNATLRNTLFDAIRAKRISFPKDVP